MSEELLQRNLITNPEKIGSWDFYNIGATSINALKESNIIRSIDYGNIARKKVDGIITKQKEVIAIVEYKQQKQFNTKNKKNNAILQEIDVFINGIEKNWIIDKLWNEKEKIELRIVDANNSLTIHGFSELLTELSCLTNEYSNIIKENMPLSKIAVNPRDDGCVTTVEIGEIFDIVKGKSKYTKSYMNKHKGEYPVYSSQTSCEGVIASIDSYDYDCKCLTWTTDGTYVGTVFLRDGKFSMTTHCGALFLKEEFKNKISLEYIQTILNNILPLNKEGEGSNKRLGVNKIEKIKIDIQVDNDNEFDLAKQKEIAEKYRIIQDIKANIKTELEKIENIKVNIGL